MNSTPIKVGDKFRHPFHPEYLCHARGFVDDQLVARYWRTGKQYWEYVVFTQLEQRMFVVVRAAKKGKSCTPSKS